MKTLIFTIIIAMLTGALLMTGGVVDRRYHQIAVTEVGEGTNAFVNTPSKREVWRYQVSFDGGTANDQAVSVTFFMCSGDTAMVTYTTGGAGTAVTHRQFHDFNGPCIDSLRVVTVTQVTADVLMWF